MAPDFLIIGAQKAGTTWLYRNFNKHPEIWMPKEKELHYFDEKMQSRLSLYERLRGDSAQAQRWRRQVSRQFKQYSNNNYTRDGLLWDLNYFLRRPTDRWYRSLFKQGRGHITGEATPNYSILKRETVQRVYEVAPDAKIIFMVRNPIERVWSHALMSASVGGSWRDKSDEYFYEQFDSTNSRIFTDYLGTVRTWNSVYPAENIFVGYMEDVSLYPDRLLDSLYAFLGATPSSNPGTIRRKIHSRDVDTMPVSMARRIANLYQQDLRALSDAFGGYASFWLHCAETLIESPPSEETIAYPLSQSYLWDDWKDSSGHEPALTLQSGTLSSKEVSI